MADEQLSLDDYQDELGGLQPIGELEVGVLLEVYARAGWDPAIVARPFAGGMVAAEGADPNEAPLGVMVCLEKNGYPLRAIGATTLDALRELAPQVARIEGRRLAA